MCLNAPTPGTTRKNTEWITQLLEGEAKTFLLGTCTECTASIAKKYAEIGVPVLHSTDHARAAVGLEPFAKTCLAL